MSQRVLKDHLDLAPKSEHVVAFQLENIYRGAAVVKDNFTLVGCNAAHHQLADGCLAAAALSNETKTLATIDVKTYIIDRRRQLLARRS